MQLTERQQKIRQKRLVFVPAWGIYVDRRTCKEVAESTPTDPTWPMKRATKKANAARKSIQRLKNLQARREKNQGK